MGCQMVPYFSRVLFPWSEGICRCPLRAIASCWGKCDSGVAAIALGFMELSEGSRSSPQRDKGCVLSIDAMGCQREIAQKVVEAGGDFCLAVKANQGNLHADVTNHVADQMKDKVLMSKVSKHETNDSGHGRKENRSYYVFEIPKGFLEAKKWTGLKAIGVAISETTRNGKISHQVRYSILSKKMTAVKFGEIVRGHWGIENQPHWQLDVSYNEDKCRIR